MSVLLAATFISGVNPELHAFNREGECGIGAVVPWTGSLWAISYAQRMPNGSFDRLCEIKPDMPRRAYWVRAVAAATAGRWFSSGTSDVGE